MEHTISNHRHHSNFTIIPNEILRDKNMSFAEKGLLSYLLSLPDDWDIRVSVIAENFGETERGILKLLKGLIEMGYCKRVAVHKDGKLAGQQYIITDIANDFSAPLKNEGAVIINSLFKEDSLDNNKEREAPSLKTRERKCLFEDSKFFDFELFKAQFTESDFADVDLFYYYNRIKNWSGANGQKKNDWILTARNWMMDDAEKGKLHRKTAPGGLDAGALEYLREMSDMDHQVWEGN